jgi:hypothetical protein
MRAVQRLWHLAVVRPGWLMFFPGTVRITKEIRVRIRIAILFFLTAAGWTSSLSAQKRAVPATESHYRVWAVDQVAVDSKGVRGPVHAAGMIAYVCAYSKDGRHALCEFVGKSYSDHNALRSAVASQADPAMQVWEKATTKRSEFEAAAVAAGYTQVDLQRLSVAVR